MPTTYASYAWIITATHQGPDRDGYIGPDDAPKMLLRRVESKAGEGHVFHMYDDAGVQLWTGRLILAAGASMTEDKHDDGPNLAGPILDFGIFHGAHSIRWDDHPEWDFN